jgi:type VI protein secretion system component Hcp
LFSNQNAIKQHVLNNSLTIKKNSMRKSIYSVFAVALMFAYSNAFSQGGMTIVMKAMEGATKLQGESTVPGHTGEIDLYSYSQGSDRCATCNVAKISDFNIMTKFTGASMSFKRLSLTGGLLTSIDITYQRPGTTTPFVFLKVHMENVLVTDEQESGSGGGDGTPTVSVSLSAQKIAWQYTLQKSDGTAGTRTSYGWDVVNNVPWTFF